MLHIRTYTRNYENQSRGGPGQTVDMHESKPVLNAYKQDFLYLMCMQIHTHTQRQTSTATSARAHTHTCTTTVVTTTKIDKHTNHKQNAHNLTRSHNNGSNQKIDINIKS